MDSIIQILILEDYDTDVDLIMLALKREGIKHQMTHVTTGEEFHSALLRQAYDVILADYTLPSYDGMSALRLTQEVHPQTPFIFVTGNMQDDTEVHCLRAGATDYVHKHNLPRLGFAVSRAIREVENRRQRRRAEEEQKKLLRAIEKSPVSIVITDLDGKIEYVNPWFCTLTGYSPEEVLGQNPRVLRSGRTPEEAYPQLWKTILAGKAWQGEFCNKKKNGELYWESASIAPVMNQEGVITNFVAVKEDITERKRQEEASLRNRRRLDSQIWVSQQKVRSIDELLEIALKEAVAFSNSQSGFIYMVDSPAQETLMNRWAKGSETGPIPPDMLQDLRGLAGLQEVIERQKPLVINEPELLQSLPCPEAHQQIWRVMLLPIVIQQVLTAVVGVVNKDSDYTGFDIDQMSLFADAIVRIGERLQVEEALKASEAHYRAVVENQTELIVRWKPDGTRTFVNEAYCRCFHLTMEEALNHPFLNLIDERDRPEVIEKMDRLCSGQSQAETDIHRSILPGGRITWQEWTDQAIYNEAGQLVEFQSVGRDVTERKQAEEHIHALNVELLNAYDATIEGWARALELRDHETEGHSRRVVDLTLQMANIMGIPEEQILHIRRGAILHDIGKMGIPDSILLKPDKLTEQEWEVMRQHPTNAYLMLSGVPFLQPALDIPYYHHERWDGKGYPCGLKGEEIPLPARIFSIIDVWDALLQDRPYRKGWPMDKVIQYLVENSGKQFDPQVVETFMKLLA